MNVIAARGLTKAFGALEAVKGIDFTVAPGEFFGLLGPNGAGKTSVIRMIYGFSPLTSGELRVFGLDAETGMREICARTGVCQQDNTLDPDLSVEENLKLFARYFDVQKAEAVRRTDELLDFFALGHKRAATVMELSGGMARRLMLARALINRPELVILDEPTTGLDPQSRHQVWDRLRRLRRQGLSVLLTTHYMEEAQALCDRLVIMDHGEILVAGAPRELIAEHVGDSVVEIEDPGEEVYAFARDKDLDYDDTERRLIVYSGADKQLESEVRERFCDYACSFRPGTLEDVFLRLTGRELRE